MAISRCCQPEARDGAVRLLSRLALAVPVPSRDMVCPPTTGKVEACAVLVRLYVSKGKGVLSPIVSQDSVRVLVQPAVSVEDDACGRYKVHDYTPLLLCARSLGPAVAGQ